MDFHGIDAVGEIKIERVTTKPAWIAAYEGRLILALDTQTLSFATSSNWVDIASATSGGISDPTVGGLLVATADVPTIQGEVIPAGTIMLMDATTVTGWTKLATIDDVLIYVSSAGNGPKGGSTWTQPGHIHSTGSHALTVSEMPSHNHPPAPGVSNFMSSTGSSHGEAGDSYGVHGTTGNAGGGSAHNHGNTGSNGTASSWRPSGYNFTRQQKNAY